MLIGGICDILFFLGDHDNFPLNGKLHTPTLVTFMEAFGLFPIISLFSFCIS